MEYKLINKKLFNNFQEIGTVLSVILLALTSWLFRYNAINNIIGFKNPPEYLFNYLIVSLIGFMILKLVLVFSNLHFYGRIIFSSEKIEIYIKNNKMYFRYDELKDLSYEIFVSRKFLVTKGESSELTSSIKYKHGDDIYMYNFIVYSYDEKSHIEKSLSDGVNPHCCRTIVSCGTIKNKQAY